MARPRVVIIGGGFGGLNAARTLAAEDVDVLVLDRKNHHVFQPLLYQVAAAALSPGDIASPIRWILRRQSNVQVWLADVTGINVARRVVQVSAASREVAYDALIVAAGVTHSYFGRHEWRAHAPGLKTLEDALAIRGRVLRAFELAERERDPAVQRRVLINEDLTIPGHPEVFVIGDLAAFRLPGGQTLPGVAQVAMQQGVHAARGAVATFAGRPRSPFRYRFYGNMATIGRHSAIGDFGWMRLKGYPAWLAWLFIHVVQLIGFRNRFSVMVQWAVSYMTYQRAVRLITDPPRDLS